ncbi:MAG: hypothetical protein U0694_13395 [Anaerolineae bacterium]
MLALLLRLYPRAWRERYEQEFRALLDERGLSAGDVLDIVVGAMDARLSPRQHLMEANMLQAGDKTGLRIIGVGAVLCAVLLWLSIINGGSVGFVDGTLMIPGIMVMFVISILLHLACRKHDPQRSRQALQITAGCFVVGLLIFLVLRQQSNTQLIVGWQGVFLAGTFGLWIVLNARIGFAAGLLRSWAMLFGVAAGVLWIILYIVMMGFDLAYQPELSSSGWMVLLFGTAIVWLIAQILWALGLALSLLLPRGLVPAPQ